MHIVDASYYAMNLREVYVLIVHRKYSERNKHVPPNIYCALNIYIYNS